MVIDAAIVGYILFSVNVDFVGRLGNEGIRIVIDELIERGNAEYVDKQKAGVFVYWKSPESWASDIFEYVSFVGLVMLGSKQWAFWACFYL